ncbi:YkgJ family cysteine cluster protein [bacterium AH-315-N03]|nr:YkgJ family cysteine cluster protein [bacterium AH-315-N03]
MSDAEYLGLRAKVDAFAAEVAARSDLTCQSGCSGCCQVQLEVCDVEANALRQAIQALPPERREALAERDSSSACALLDADGRCEVYEARPLVCRTQGLPLRYPANTVPVDAVMGRAGDADVTWCPLNFTLRKPKSADVLDAERVDVMLALVNRRAAGESLALRRRSIREVVAEATR